jgi:hypothetical protein
LTVVSDSTLPPLPPAPFVTIASSSVFGSQPPLVAQLQSLPDLTAHIVFEPPIQKEPAA